MTTDRLIIERNRERPSSKSRKLLKFAGKLHGSTRFVAPVNNDVHVMFFSLSNRGVAALNVPMIREFRLSAAGRGVSCDGDEAFIGPIASLKRTRAQHRDVWEPRECDDLSAELSAYFGLPIDLSSKASALTSIAWALNKHSVALAQIATLQLKFPEPPSVSNARPPRDRIVKFIRDLSSSGLIKDGWDADLHPRWPTGAPNSQGGRFAPKLN